MNYCLAGLFKENDKKASFSCVTFLLTLSRLMLTDLIHQSGIEVHRMNIDTDAQMLNVLNVNQYSCVCYCLYYFMTEIPTSEYILWRS